MSAILFGSIGTIVDTSEIQRQSFNQAFAAHELNWHWHREEYIQMLERSGGQNRITDYANSLGQTVDAEAIHRSKSELFQKNLTKFPIQPRLGVIETIQRAKNEGLKVAWVTTTSQKNIEFLLKVLYPNIQASDFDLILDFSSVKYPKPDKGAYILAIEKLGKRLDEYIAIEDNVDGVEAATSAGLTCVAFPNQNTAHYDFAKAKLLVNHLDFNELQKFRQQAVNSK